MTQSVRIPHSGLDRQYLTDNWVAGKHSFLGCCRASHDQHPSQSAKRSCVQPQRQQHHDCQYRPLEARLQTLRTSPIFGSANTIGKIPGMEISSPYNVNMDSGNWPWSNTWRSNQWKNDLSWTHGAHNTQIWLLHGCTRTEEPADLRKHSRNLPIQWDKPLHVPRRVHSSRGPGVGLADFLLGNATSITRRSCRIPSQSASTRSISTAWTIGVPRNG